MKTNVRERSSPRSENPKADLLNAVASCLLFENTFYEKGSDVAQRIVDLCTQVEPDYIANLASYSRTKLNLRHVALWLAVQHVKHPKSDKSAAVIDAVIQRADELAEFLKLYWLDQPDAPLAHQVKKGLAKAFTKFNAYQLAKYNRDGEIKLRDVLFLCHAKPRDAEQEALWKKLVDKTLESPDTWEVELSAGKDKRETWERLLREKKLGYLALLRNLRNMKEASVDRKLVIEALLNGAEKSRALPFQFVAAWRHAPAYASALDQAMIMALRGTKLFGLAETTNLLVDVSGSMDAALSAKSQINRIDAASALAVLMRETCVDVRVFTFSSKLVEVPAVRGLGLVTAIHDSQSHGSTELRASVHNLQERFPRNRLIVITDEQGTDGRRLGDCETPSYLVNVASYAKGMEIGGRWCRISGFSERLVDFIFWHENKGKNIEL